MKQVNVRFIITMLGITAVVGAIGYGVHAYQTSRHAGFFLERAARAEQVGDLSEALRELNHYLRLAPEDHAARVRMGILLADARQDYDAFTVLEKALRQTDDQAARRTLVDVLLRMRRWSDARAHLEQDLLPATPDDPVLLDRLAQCQWAAEEYAAAQQSLERAIQQDPQQIESYQRLISLLDSQPQLAAEPQADTESVDAATWQQRMMAANPQAVVAYLSRTNERLSQSLAAIARDDSTAQKLAAARQALEAVLADVERARTLIASCRQSLQQLRDAAEQARAPDDAAERLVTLGQHLRSLDQAEQAIDRLRGILQAGDDDQRVLEQLVILDQVVTALEAESWWVTARSHWALARADAGPPSSADTPDVPDVPTADTGTADTGTADTGTVDTGTADAGTADAGTADAGTAVRRESQQVQLARQAAQMGLELQPQDARPYGLLAEIELVSGDRAAAKRWLQQGVETLETRSNLPLNLIRLQLEDGELDAANAVLDSMRQRGFDASLVSYFAARIEYAAGNWQQAVRLLTDASAQVADEPDLAKQIEYHLGRSYQQLQKSTEEIRAYRRALVIDPQYRPARLMLADALRRSGQWDQALEQYQSGLPATPDSQLLIAQVQLQRIRSLPASQQDWQALQSLLDQLDQSLPDSPDAVLLRADMLVARQQADEAESLLRSAMTRLPESVAIRCALVQLMIQDEAQPRIDQAARLLDTAQRELGDSVAIRLTRGALLVRRDADQAATPLRQLAENVDEFSEAARFNLWRRLAQLSSASGDLEQSEQLTRRVAQHQPRDLAIWLQLLAIVLEKKDFEAGDQVLRQIAQVEGETDGPIWTYCQAATLAARAEETDNPAFQTQAVEFIDKTLAARPNWPRALLLGALLADRQGDTQAATERYLRLIELGNDTTQVMREAVRLLTAGARYVEADALLTRLEQQTGLMTPELQRYRARISGGLEDFEAALPAAREVAATSEAFEDHLWLARLCGLFAVRQRQQGAEDQATQLVQEGEQALDRAAQLAPDAVQVGAVRLQFLVRLGRQQQVEQVLQEAVGTFGDQPGVMANLYLAANQPQRAAEQYQAELARWPEDLPLIRAAAEFSLRSGRRQLATEQLEAIVTGRVEVEPDELIWARRVLALALREDEDAQRLEDALALIEQNLKAQPDSVLDLRTKAMLLSGSDDAARHQQARQILESLIERQAPGVADTRRLLAQLYLADGDWTRALPHLRLATDPDSIARYVQAMLGRGQLDEAELGIVRLEEIAPDRLVTVVLRTRLLFRRGSYAQAEGMIDTLVSPEDPTAAEPPVLLAAATLLEDLGRQLADASSPTLGQQWLAKAESYVRQYAEQGPDQQAALVRFLAGSDRLDQALAVLESMVEQASMAAAAQAAGSFDRSTALDGPVLARLEAVFAQLLERHDRALALLDANARVMIAAQQFAVATERYREILEKQPTNFAIKNNLAELLALQGQDLDQALQLVQETIQAMGPQPSLLDTRATVYWARGEYPRAVEDMQSVVAEVPRPNRYFHLARALHAAGNLVAARDALRQAQLRGLQAEDLHPLERADYQQLLETFDQL